ncbi:MAG: WD40 repeat domain-containing protein [Alphaproteobacteria bacterium]|nr:WD40 repeat domain-containing protein [Alphaproteobacteria bacterium]
MSREVTEAHYLHERSGLEAVLRPPVKQPTALAWVPKREVLIVATRDGELVSVDPVLGTRVITESIGEAGVLALHEDRKRYLTMNRQGGWTVGTLDGETLINARHTYLGGMDGFFAGEYVVMLGDEGDGKRTLSIFKEDRRTAHLKLPSRVSATVSANGGLLLLRSTHAGLEVLPLGALKKGRSFQKGMESTMHRLRPSGPHILGFTSTGIAIWNEKGGQPKSMRLPDLTAGDISHAGEYLGLGTRNGAVALSRISSLEKRVHPDLVRAFNSPVTSVAFSQRGRWLATGAEGLRIWSWED